MPSLSPSSSRYASIDPRQQVRLAALGHDREHLAQRQMAVGEDAFHQLLALGGGEVRVRQALGELEVGAHEADDLAHLLAHLKHSLLAAGGMGGIEEHRCVNRDFLFHDETISCH